MSDEHTDTPAEPTLEPAADPNAGTISIRLQIVDLGDVMRAALMKAAAEKVDEVISASNLEAAVEAEAKKQFDAMISTAVGDRFPPDIKAKIADLVKAVALG